MMRYRVLAIAFVFALVAAGCAEQAPEPAPPVGEPQALSADAGAPMGLSDADHDGVDRAIEVVLTEFAITPGPFEAEAGERVRFVVRNHGSLEHEFRLTNRNSAIGHVEGGHEGHHDEEGSSHGEILHILAPGETKRLVLTFSEKSTFDLLTCLIPGHYESGMEAPFVVHGAIAVAMDHHDDGADDHHDDGAADHHDDGAADHHDDEAAHDEGEADHHDDGAAHDEGETDHHDDGAAHDEGEGDHHDDEAAHDEGEGDHHDEGEGHEDDGAADHHEDGSFDREIEVMITGDGYEPATIEVTTGERIRFVLHNMGDAEHEFRLTTAHVVEEQRGGGGGHGHDEIVVLIAPGAMETVDVTFDDHAEYEVFACLLPGHVETGELVFSG